MWIFFSFSMNTPQWRDKDGIDHEIVQPTVQAHSRARPPSLIYPR